MRFHGLQRQVLHLADADVAEDRNAFRLHEQVVRRLRPAELAEAGALETRRLVPMNLTGDLVHGGAPVTATMKVAAPQRNAALVAISIVACLRELLLHVQCVSTQCNGRCRCRRERRKLRIIGRSRGTAACR